MSIDHSTHHVLDAPRRKRGTPRGVWVVSGLVAVLFHVGLFAFWPDQEIELPTSNRVVPPLQVTTERPLVLAVGGAPIPLEGSQTHARWLASVSKPRVWNEAVLQGVLARVWPPELWSWGEGGRATVQVEVDRWGRVAQATLQEGGGDPALDLAFLALAEALRFHAAQVDGRPVQSSLEISLLVDPILQSGVATPPVR
jgi:TonB family protein